MREAATQQRKRRIEENNQNMHVPKRISQTTLCARRTAAVPWTLCSCKPWFSKHVARFPGKTIRSHEKLVCGVSWTVGTCYCLTELCQSALVLPRCLQVYSSRILTNWFMTFLSFCALWVPLFAVCTAARIACAVLYAAEGHTLERV